MDFKLVSDYKPQGDQGRAIEQLLRGIYDREQHQVLLGVTGSGKTFTMAKVIEATNRPALVMAHNKTLAAQLYHEFKNFFPHNAVEYFVSYYDYYQPEAYVPATDLYIEKEATINDELDKLRLSATRSLFERRDALIVASVSCIYGLGSPEAYYGMMLFLEKGQKIKREDITRKLVDILYERTNGDFRRGTFRVRGDVIEVYPTYDDMAYRIELWGDEISSLTQIDPLFGTVKQKYMRLPIYPKTHYVMKEETRASAVDSIKKELAWWEVELEKQGRLVEAQRIHQRTMFDLEMIKAMGFCHGIENYSRHFTGRLPGEPPPTLLDYFPRDFLMFIDESHQTVPQLRGMYAGDRSRKETLVEYGFRMPSALDNRPLTFEEFEHRTNQLVYVSATPGPYELTKSAGVVVEQIIRPTGLIDPPVEIRPVKGQIDDLLHEIRARVELGQRVLVTTLTKRMCEDLAEYYAEVGREVPLHAFGDRDAGAGEDSARSAQGRVRCVDWDQFVARGARSAGSFAGRDSGCGQRRISAVDGIADSDHWALRAAFEWAGDSLCGSSDRFDEARDRRDLAPARDSDCVQRREWNHAGVDCPAAGYDSRRHCRGRLCRSDGRRVRGLAGVQVAGRGGWIHRQT